MNIRTGSILLVSGYSKRSLAIQKFQKKSNPESGMWNHSGIIFRCSCGNIYVAEADILQGRKYKAGFKITPLSYYLNDKNYKLMVLTPDFTYDTCKVIERIYYYVGTPYDYLNLIVLSPIRLLFRRYIGRIRSTDRSFVCHEGVQKIWNDIISIFPQHSIGAVDNIFISPNFKHKVIQ